MVIRQRTMRIGVSFAVATALMSYAVQAPSAAPVDVAITSAPDGVLGVWEPLGSGANSQVSALTIDPVDDTLYAGGSFTTIGGVNTTGIAQWNGSSWSQVSGGITIGSSVNALAVDPITRDVYAGGTFTQMGDDSASNIARWSRTGWHALGSGVNGTVRTIWIDDSILGDDSIYVGGDFRTAGGAPEDLVAAWSGSGWSGLGLNLNNYVSAIVRDDTLYAGGAFIGNLSGFNGATWSTVPGVNGAVNALAVGKPGELYAGGYFLDLATIPANGIGLLASGSWRGLGANLGGDRTVNAVVLDNRRDLVYIAGKFLSQADFPANSVAVYDIALQVWIPFQGAGGNGVTGISETVTSLAFTDDSRASLYVGGSFASAGGVSATTNIARWTWQPPQGINTVTRAFDDAAGFTITGEGFIGVASTGAVRIGANAVTYTRDDTSTIRVTSWTADPGTYNITVDGVGGTGVVGTFTRAAQPVPPPPPPPPPPPDTPPGPPSDIVAVAADASAAVSWVAPTDPGSAPITSYQVSGTPGGTCTVDAPLTQCEITGLTNGVTYQFAVRAVNSVGPGEYSPPSDPVVPSPVPPPPPPPPPPVEVSIVITGTRGDVRGQPGVIVRGTTTGLKAGARMVPWLRFPGPKPYARGDARPRIASDGDFVWQRRTKKKVYLTMRSVNDQYRSNRVIIRTR